METNHGPGCATTLGLVWGSHHDYPHSITYTTEYLCWYMYTYMYTISYYCSNTTHSCSVNVVSTDSMSKNTDGSSVPYDSLDINTPSKNISVVSTFDNSLDLKYDANVGMYEAPVCATVESIGNIGRDTNYKIDIQSIAYSSDNHSCIPHIIDSSVHNNNTNTKFWTNIGMYVRPAARSSSDGDPFTEFRLELDSHTNMLVVGCGAYILVRTDNTADVSTYIPDYESTGIPIVDAVL